MSNNQIFRNFGDVTRHLAATQPDRVALTFEGRDTTYGEFERYTNRVAAALLASGVKKGERVAYFGKNSDRYLEIFFGAAKVGAVTTPVNWRLAGPELAYILQDFACSHPLRRRGVRRHCRAGRRRLPLS